MSRKLLFKGQRGTYALIEQLGKGGMGVVHSGFDVASHEPCAIKFSKGGTQEDERRFQNEIKALREIQHANVTMYKDHGRYKGGLFLVMQLLSGIGLDHLLKQARIYTDVALRMGIDVARALGAVHRHGIVHRDVKPANIMEARGAWMLTDFGIALVPGTPRLTREWNVVGTPLYMAPEAAMPGSPVTAAADVYSLCVVLYEVLTTLLPFNGQSLLDIQCQIMNTTPDRPSKHVPGLDPRLDAVIMKGLSQNPLDRYPTGDALAAALQEILDFPGKRPHARRKVGAAGVTWPDLYKSTARVRDTMPKAFKRKSDRTTASHKRTKPIAKWRSNPRWMRIQRTLGESKPCPVSTTKHPKSAKLWVRTFSVRTLACLRTITGPVFEKDNSID